MVLLTKVAYYQHEIYTFFHDLFNKHRMSTIFDQIYVPSPIFLASPVPWALGLLLMESSGCHSYCHGCSCSYSNLGNTHFLSTPPSEC